jgi:hypothetical protein
MATNPDKLFRQLLPLMARENGYRGEKTETLRSIKQKWQAIVKTWDADESWVDINPGVVAVSGDLHVKAMKGRRGFDFFGSADSGYVIRSIRGLDDYTGGPNQWVSFPNELPIGHHSYEIRSYRDFAAMVHRFTPLLDIPCEKESDMEFDW